MKKETKELMKALFLGGLFGVAVYLFMMFFMHLIEGESASDEILKPEIEFKLK